MSSVKVLLIATFVALLVALPPLADAWGTDTQPSAPPTEPAVPDSNTKAEDGTQPTDAKKPPLIIHTGGIDNEA